MSARFSIIIPTLNESARIERTLSAARSAFGDAAEYLVADGGSSDGTRAIAERAGARVITCAPGRGVQLDQGFQASSGEICVFLHADTLPPETAQTAIEAALRDATVSGGAFRVAFGDHADPGQNANSAKQVRWLAHAINVRSRLFRTATGDQAMFARRSALEAIGGVPRVPLFEDVRLCRNLKRVGSFRIVDAAVETSPRLWQSVGSLRGIGLHLLLRSLHAAGASPERLSRYYPTVR